MIEKYQEEHRVAESDICTDKVPCTWRSSMYTCKIDSCINEDGKGGYRKYQICPNGDKSIFLIFNIATSSGGKYEAAVKCPATLDLDGKKWRKKCVVTHEGDSVFHGHYRAYVFSAGGSIVVYDDSKVECLAGETLIGNIYYCVYDLIDEPGISWHNL
jgi:hypothetical protein